MSAKTARRVTPLARIERVAGLTTAVAVVAGGVAAVLPTGWAVVWVALAAALIGGLGMVLARRSTRPIVDELADAELRYRSLFKTSRDPIYISSRDGRLIEINGAFEDLLGYERDDLVGNAAHRLYAGPAERVSFQRRIEKAGEVVDYEVRLRGRDGAELICLETAAVRYGDDGEILGYQGIVRDVTEQRRNQERLRAQRDRAQQYLDLVDEMIVALGVSGTILMVNAAALRVMGYDDESDLVGKNWFETCLPAHRRAEVRELHAGVITGDDDATEVEDLVITRDGETRRIAWRNTVVLGTDGETVTTLSSGRDITEQRRAEAQLQSSRQQLRNLAGRLHAVREEERTAIARELHDALGQKLTAIRMDLGLLQEETPAGGRIGSLIEDMVDQVEGSLRRVRAVAKQLRPPELDALGLADAVETHVHEFRERSGLEVELELDASLPRHAEASIVMFRILQEALTNVARHAQAERVAVSLTAHDSGVILAVEDDGVGITTDQLESADSIGLIGVRERVGALGGSVEITALPGKGTRLQARLPLRHTPAGASV
jgi:PAS domain S-box-containing protein